MSKGKREISFDTETTGLDPAGGHKLIEIGCVEMINRIPTGKSYHTYIDPKRDVPEGAFNVHGLSEEFLSGKPEFSDIVDEFLEFVGDARLIIHNARFDMKFTNHHLAEIGREIIPDSQVFCTLEEARRKFPGSPASLDALCKRFNIDISARDKHGALLDAELLAAMYLELMGGSQVALELGAKGSGGAIISGEQKGEVLEARPHAPNAEELSAHNDFLKKIKEPIW